jgi:hypothetical protein
MALIGQMDLGIGDTVPAAYVRIVGFTFYTYNSSLSQIEIIIYNYHSKVARMLEIAKAQAPVAVSAAQTQTASLSVGSATPAILAVSAQTWIQNNVTARTTGPLQTMKWATTNLSIFSGIDLTTAPPNTIMPYLYGWLATNQVMGSIANVQNDMDTAATMWANYQTQNASIFGS